MAVRTGVFSGTVREINLKEGMQGAKGPYDMATMTVVVRDNVKVDDGYKTIPLFSLDLVAFGKTAQTWAKRFKQDDAVEVTGRIRGGKTFTRQDGSTGLALQIEGFSGSAPEVDWAPKPYEPRNGDSGGRTYGRSGSTQEASQEQALF